MLISNLAFQWSLVLSAALQGLSMAMYTQVRSTAGYVGLNALGKSKPPCFSGASSLKH